MSETNTSVPVINPALKVTRGEGEKATTLQLVPFKILKGKRADTVYNAPLVTVENVQDVIDWIGIPTLVNEFGTLLKRKFQNIHFGAVLEDGTFNQEKFLIDAANFTATGMKMKEINDKLEELSASIAKMLHAGTYSKRGHDGKPTTEALEAQSALAKLGDESRAYMAMKEERSRKPKEEEVEEPAVAE